MSKPPIRAPNPSRDVNIPISRASNWNFSISKILISAIKGNEKILNTKVSKITVSRFKFFLVSERTLLKELKKFPSSLIIELVSLWVITQRSDKKYRQNRKNVM